MHFSLGISYKPIRASNSAVVLYFLFGIVLTVLEGSYWMASLTEHLVPKFLQKTKVTNNHFEDVMIFFLVTSSNLLCLLFL